MPGEQSEQKTVYALQVGEAGAPRLRLLNQMCNPLSLEFIKKVIDLRNKSILDLGCGIGMLSCLLAKESLPKGHVVAADISQEQLDIAARNAKSANVTNIKFKQISAFDIDQLNVKFDLIFCRFLLIHLGNAADVIKKLSTIMHAGSVVICEETNSVESVSCEPRDQTFEQLKEFARKQVQAAKANYSLGKELPTLFAKNNYQIVQQGISQAVLSTRELKQQLWQGVEEVGPLLIKNNDYTAEQIKELVSALKKFANESTATVKYFECTQVAVKLAESSPASSPLRSKL